MPREKRCLERIDAKREKMPRENRENRVEKSRMRFWCQAKYLVIFFFCCIAELAIKPCRSSRSKLRGEFGIPKHLQNRKQKHNKATKNTTQTKDNKKRQVLECETRGEKRVKRPKRPNALICRTPGGSMRYP